MAPIIHWPGDMGPEVDAMRKQFTDLTETARSIASAPPKSAIRQWSYQSKPLRPCLTSSKEPWTDDLHWMKDGYKRRNSSEEVKSLLQNEDHVKSLLQDKTPGANKIYVTHKHVEPEDHVTALLQDRPLTPTSVAEGSLAEMANSKFKTRGDITPTRSSKRDSSSRIQSRIRGDATPPRSHVDSKDDAPRNSIVGVGPGMGRSLTPPPSVGRRGNMTPPRNQKSSFLDHPIERGKHGVSISKTASVRNITPQRNRWPNMADDATYGFMDPMSGPFPALPSDIHEKAGHAPAHTKLELGPADYKPGRRHWQQHNSPSDLWMRWYDEPEVLPAARLNQRNHVQCVEFPGNLQSPSAYPAQSPTASRAPSVADCIVDWHQRPFDHDFPTQSKRLQHFANMRSSMSSHSNTRSH